MLFVCHRMSNMCILTFLSSTSATADVSISFGSCVYVTLPSTLSMACLAFASSSSLQALVTGTKRTCKTLMRIQYTYYKDFLFPLPIHHLCLQLGWILACSHYIECCQATYMILPGAHQMVAIITLWVKHYPPRSKWVNPVVL